MPARDEEGNLLLLARGLREALAGIDYEIFMVDDASSDGSRAEMLAAQVEDTRIRIVERQTPGGKSGALWSGFLHAEGTVLATIDADLQNDPADVRRCFDALVPGVDVVNGKRDRRQDGLVRFLASRVGNGLRRLVLDGPLTDAGTGIRVFRRDCLAALVPFDGMHRFFGELVVLRGHRCIEIAIAQRPRHAGVAKYGIRNRAFPGLIDVLGMWWLQRRLVIEAGREVRP